jgi:hypothetical protein
VPKGSRDGSVPRGRFCSGRLAAFRAGDQTGAAESQVAAREFFSAISDRQNRDWIGTCGRAYDPADFLGFESSDSDGCQP